MSPASVRHPADDEFTSFMDELARNTDLDGILFRLRHGHHADRHDWCGQVAPRLLGHNGREISNSDYVEPRSYVARAGPPPRPPAAVQLDSEVTGPGQLVLFRRLLRRWAEVERINGDDADGVVIAVGEAVMKALEHGSRRFVYGRGQPTGWPGCTCTTGAPGRSQPPRATGVRVLSAPADTGSGSSVSSPTDDPPTPTTPAQPSRSTSRSPLVQACRTGVTPHQTRHDSE